MKLILTILLLTAPLAVASADVAAILEQADSMHNQGTYQEAVTLLTGALSSASGGKEQAELYWRASRETLELGDIADLAGKSKDAIAVFNEGEKYADKAIAADPQNDFGYYWKSANIGRAGQVKGVLNALNSAQPMKDLLVKELSLNPERSDPYYVLGELYRELPGWPVSFGNLDAAVSLGRKAVDLRQQQVQQGTEKELVYNFSTELAKTLYKRNWTSAARKAAQKEKAAKFAAATTPWDKASFYEGTVTLTDMSDRDEAKGIIQWVTSELGKATTLSAPEKKDLKKAQFVQRGW